MWWEPLVVWPRLTPASGKPEWQPPGQLGSCTLTMQSYYQPRAPVTAWQRCLSTWQSVADYYCQGLPQRLSGKEPACQCRRCRFEPWVGKISWRREWQPTTIFLPGKPHGQRSLAGYTVHWVTKELDTTSWLNINCCQREIQADVS